MKLTDVGTRYEHYRELLDLWENGYDILESRINAPEVTLVPTDLLKLVLELEGAITLMTKQLEIQSDLYMQMYKVANVIEGIQEDKLLTEGKKDAGPTEGVR